jgi:hypothetical protein
MGVFNFFILNKKKKNEKCKNMYYFKACFYNWIDLLSIANASELGEEGKHIF